MAQPHTPALHTAPVEHGLLQPPQCSRLVCVSTQAPLHAICVPGHTQAPAVQLCPLAQAFSHEPRWAVVVRSAQAPLHKTCGAVQLVTGALQMPWSQIWFWSQAIAQLPQCFGSDSVSVHGPAAIGLAPPAPPIAAAPAELSTFVFEGVPGLDGLEPSTHATTQARTPSPRNAQGPNRMSLIEFSLGHSVRRARCTAFIGYPESRPYFKKSGKIREIICATVTAAASA